MHQHCLGWQMFHNFCNVIFQWMQSQFKSTNKSSCWWPEQTCRLVDMLGCAHDLKWHGKGSNCNDNGKECHFPKNVRASWHCKMLFFCALCQIMLHFLTKKWSIWTKKVDIKNLARKPRTLTFKLAVFSLKFHCKNIINDGSQSFGMMTFLIIELLHTSSFFF